MKRLIRYIVPRHIEDPGLLFRMIASRDRAAWFTLYLLGLGLILTPIDMLLAHFERRHYQRAAAPQMPIIFVCGAPRTGTTLVSQLLIKNLPVSYFNNLTSLFPRSPIVANRLFGRLIGRKIGYHSYYSKTTSLSGPNDAFYIWNRWMAEDETGMQCVLIESESDEMVRFFGAYERAFQRPVLGKNNSLNTRANAVASSLTKAIFICMTRDPAYVAQSLLEARLEIQGDLSASLWVDNPNKSHIESGNYVQDVCDQVLYHERKIAEQLHLIGADRYWIVPYEEFCREPARLVKRLYEEVWGETIEVEKLRARIEPFEISNKIRIDPEVFAEVQQTIARMRREQLGVDLTSA